MTRPDWDNQFRETPWERQERQRRARQRKGNACAGGVELTYTAQGTLPCPECGATSKEPCAREVQRLAERDAVLTYLLEYCSYGYGGGSCPPEPVEMGIAWEWRQSTPEKPGMYQQLCSDALAYYERYVNEMDPGGEPTDWDREVMRHRTALSGARS